MYLAELDSRRCLGTDIERACFADGPRMEDLYVVYPPRTSVRVILGDFGNVMRMSAPQLNIAVEGATRGEVWTKFLEQAAKREDRAWLTFDVGPTRPDEIARGLDAPEDEAWYEPSE